MYTEENLLPLSAIQHLLFCRRQCALIHVEQLWAENRFTAEGRIMHERVDRGDRISRKDVRVEYGLPLRSFSLGLTGKADVVEFHLEKGIPDIWRPFPVEYKRGKPKRDKSDMVQLCAQAICLEEILNIAVPDGALFYGKTRRRQDVVFDKSLRCETAKAAKELHTLFSSGNTPNPEYASRCEKCSFISLCIPKAIGKKRSALKWFNEMIQNEDDYL